MPEISDIGETAKDATDKEFADALAKYTKRDPDEAKTLFPTKQDQKELVSLIKIVGDATDDNERKAKLIARVGDVAGVLVTITKKFATGIG